MKVCCISDTHGLHSKVIVPECDLLIHAGDLTNDIGRASLRDFLTWFESQPAKHKVFIAGNHDGAFEKWPDLAKLMVQEVAPSCVYLQDSGVEIEGLKIWGSPVTPTFFDWYFNRDRGKSISRHWDMIPDDTNILITHGPPKNVLDKVFGAMGGEGCEDLSNRIEHLKHLKLHVFGHLHMNGGMSKKVGETIHINASVVNEDYNVVNPAMIFYVADC